MDIEVNRFITNMVQYVYSINDDIHYELNGYFYNVRIKEKIANKIENDHELIWIDCSDSIKLMLIEYQAAAIELALKEK